MALIRTRLRAEDETPLQSLAAHEAGHAVVAAAFGLAPKCAIGGPGTGICRFTLGTPFQNAAVSWAGIVAEDLLGCRNGGRTVPEIELSAKTFLIWVGEMRYKGLDACRSYCSDDINEIRSYPELLEAARAAFTILTERRELLAWRQARLADDCRERFRRAQVRNDFQADQRAALAAVR